MGQAKATGEQIEQARQMRDTGMSYAKIAVILDMPHETVRRHINLAAREYNEAYRATHKEEAGIYRTMHKAASKVRRMAYNAAHKAEIKAYGAAYNAMHRKERKVYNAAYRSTHKTEIAAYNAVHGPIYNATHKAEHKTYHAAYYKNHLPEFNVYSATRRALKAGALIGATANQLNEIAETYRRAKEDPKVRCYLCNKLIPMGHRHVDHIMPLSKGGAHRPSNLAVACDKCNLHKNNKLPEEMGVLI